MIVLCAVCELRPPDHYRICVFCRAVLVVLPIECRSRFVDEMLASPAAHRDCVCARWHDENRRHFYPESAGED